MARTPLDPTKLDVDLIREMYRNGAINVAGMDPRLNATRLSRRLKVGRRRVAARLRLWREAGFLDRYDVWPHPSLLGEIGAWANVRMADVRLKPALLERIGLIDGILGAFEYVGPWTSVSLVAEDPATLGRKLDLLRGLAGVTEVEGPLLWYPPPPKRTLTPLDVRILRALRERPNATLTETARRVGVSTRTMTRRYEELVGGAAVWYIPLFDFTALAPPVVSLTLTVPSHVPPETIVRALRKRYPMILEARSFDEPTESPDELLFFSVVLSSAAEVEDLERFAASIDGVSGVEVLVLVRIYSYPAWVDRRLQSLASPPVGSAERG